MQSFISPRKLLIHCTVLDCTGGPLQEKAAILVEGEQIVAIGPEAELLAGVQTAEGCEIVDLGGCYALPGLMDMHRHLGQISPDPTRVRQVEPEAAFTLRCYKDALDLLHAGVTTVRVLGVRNFVDLALRDTINMGVLPGPRIFGAGIYIGPSGGHGGVVSQGPGEANGLAGFRAAARRVIAAGADWVKIMISGGLAGGLYGPEVAEMFPEEVQAVTEIAHRAGKRVTAHAGSAQAIIEAVRAGLDCVEHGYLLDDRAADLMAEKGTYYVPTLAVAHDETWQEEDNWHQWKRERARQMAPAHMAAFQAALRAGVKIACGSDRPMRVQLRTEFTEGGESGYPVPIPRAVPGHIREMEILNQAGLSPLRTLQAATKVAAELCQVEDRLGTLEPGKVADIIATTHNPLDDITSLRDTVFVMKAGAVIRNSVRA